MSVAVSPSQKWRRPNVDIACENCAARVVKYVRPSWALPRFCSKSCATTFAMKDPARRALQAENVRGERSAHWTGDAVSVEGGRKRARRMYAADACSCCGATPAERHHRDGDTANNSIDNIEIVCRRCHMDHDGRLDAVRVQMREIQPLGVEAAARRFR